MTVDPRYRAQVELVVRSLPIVATEACFALKGGTAINLFVRDLPRLSVDIDLAFLPRQPRAESLEATRAALGRIAQRIDSGALQGASARFSSPRQDELRLIVRDGRSQIKVEISPVLRGSLHEPQTMRCMPAVIAEFGTVTVPVLSLPDLYGGKICAALDRQHPRDWFDVMLLLDAEELDRSVFEGFLTYLVSHGRPINELLAPRWKPLAESYAQQFAGMTTSPVSLDQLETTRERLLTRLRELMTAQDKAFLLSLKAGEPEWTLFPYPRIAELPAVQWKLHNLRRMKTPERLAARDRLQAVFDTYGL